MGTVLYDKNGIALKRFFGGTERGVCYSLLIRSPYSPHALVHDLTKAELEDFYEVLHGEFEGFRPVWCLKDQRVKHWTRLEVDACPRCNNTGYSGRCAVVEAMTVTDDIRKLIISRASSMEIGKVAISQGMKTLREVALEKVREGLTTLEQTLVVTAAH